MARKDTTHVGAELDPDTDLELERWAKHEGRSKRRHLAVLARKLTTLRKTAPADLARLGLLDAGTVARA